MYITSINTWASGDCPLAQLVKELDLCLFLCVTKRVLDPVPSEPISNSSIQFNKDQVVKRKNQICTNTTVRKGVKGPL